MNLTIADKLALLRTRNTLTKSADSASSFCEGVEPSLAGDKSEAVGSRNSAQLCAQLALFCGHIDR